MPLQSEMRLRGLLMQAVDPRAFDPSRPLNGEQLLREAVLLLFRDPWPGQCSRLRNLSASQWRSLLHWLDISGLALYFFDRVSELRLRNWLPPPVLARLHRNLIDNTARTRGMIAESAALQCEFQQANLPYAALKGITLWPIATPRPEFRSQFDLDFLIAETAAPEARQILERRGYRLYAISGRSWEFKRNERPGLSLKDLYKDLPSYAVELHVEADAPGRPSLLQRLEYRELRGVEMPVLSPVDLFLGHGLHVYKHICSEFFRASHLLEFRRHVLARRDDNAFWSALQSVAGDNPRAVLGLGVATLLITRVMGDFAPDALTSWTVDRLPPAARMWIQVHGRRVALSSFPGSKLYLLLQRELESAGVPTKRSTAKALLPSRLPPAVIRPFPNEAFPVRVARYRMQLQFILLRLHFHSVEGLRYAWEARRWRRLRNRLLR